MDLKDLVVSCRYSLLFYSPKLKARPLQTEFLCTDPSFLQSQQDQSKFCSRDALTWLELTNPGAFKYKGTSGAVREQPRRRSSSRLILVDWELKRVVRWAIWEICLWGMPELWNPGYSRFLGSAFLGAKLSRRRSTAGSPAKLHVCLRVISKCPVCPFRVK